MRNAGEEPGNSVSRNMDEKRGTTRSIETEWRLLNEVLDVLPVYVILLTPDYHVPFANRFFRERFGESHGARCFEYLFNRTEPCEVCETYKVLKKNSSLEWEWRGPDGHDYHIFDFPFSDPEGSSMIMEVGIDITDRKRTETELATFRDHLKELVSQRTTELEATNSILQKEIAERIKSQEKLTKTNCTLRALSEINKSLTSATSEQEFLNLSCRSIIHECGHKIVWIGYKDHNEEKSVTPVAYHGFDEGYIANLKITWEDRDRGKGPTGTAIRTGKPTFCRDMLTDPKFEPWREEATRRGYRSSAVFPLNIDGEIIGAMNVYSVEPDPFSEVEIKLMTEIGENISSGIRYIRTKLARELSEQTLAHERNNLQKIFDTANVGMFLLDSEGRIERVNNMLSHLLKKDMKAMTGEQPGNGIGCIHITEDPRGCGYSSHCTACPVRNTFSSVLKNGEPVHGVEADIQVMQEGEPARLWVDLSADPVMIDEKEHVILVMNNITDRKKAETALDQTEQRYRGLVEQSPVAVLINKDNKVVYVNPAAISLFGASRPGELLGKSPTDLFHADYHRIMKERIDILMTGGTVPLIEGRIRRLDGTYRYTEITAVPFQDNGGTSIQVILHDITDRKSMEESIRKMNAELEKRVHERTIELENAMQEQELFTYSISHDLRAPLRHISGYLGLIDKKSGENIDKVTRNYMGEVSDAAVKMGALIDSILTFSRLSRAPMKKSRIDLNFLAENVMKLFRVETSSREIIWKVNPLPDIWGDPGLLEIVLTNLLSNAVKFTRDKSPSIIEIGCNESETESTIYIKDNGAGFDNRYFNKLFKPFERLHGDHEYEGTGIGLAIVKRIIQRHGGRVRGEGKPGEGATFCFSLPRYAHPA